MMILNKKKVGYFHKWFDGINKFNNQAEQFAIIELENGVICDVSIKNYRIRFFSDDENFKYSLDKSIGSFKKLNF